MATTGIKVPGIPREAVPTASPLEGGDIICGRCGKEMERSVIMGPRSVEAVVHTCINEETGCRYQLKRTVPVTMYSTSGIRDEPKK